MARIVIGLDFGTTYSGVAYCDDNAAEQGIAGIKLVTGWPGIASQNATNEKVPSRIAYLSPPSTGMIWGNQIRANTKETVHACMKLRLDDNMRGSDEFRQLLAFLTQRVGGLNMDIDNLLSDDGRSSASNDGPPPAYPGKDPVDMVADYLSKIRETAWHELEKTYGPSMFGTMRKELIVTVPAVWSERAKDLTLKAVQRAKFDATKVALVTEPEAAAIYTLKDMQKGHNREEINVGDVFVLCDAGGGTVDLISYKITQVEPVFRIEEAAVGSGDKCGATYVDREFLAWLERWIGAEAFGRIPASKMRHGSQMMTAFETAKFNFSGDEEEMDIQMPSEAGIDDDEERNIDDRTLSFKRHQMQQVFDPCVKRTLELIAGQVTSVIQAGHGNPKMVLVVGGFGRNPYLYRKIQEYCDRHGIQTRQPPFPWSAVVRGAVCRGLESAALGSGLVAVRLARKHYGTPVAVPFRPEIHDAADMFIDDITGRKMAGGQMRWLCSLGDRLPEDRPRVFSIDVSRQFEDGDERELCAVLAGCGDEVPPQRWAHDAAKYICRVRGNFDNVPLSTFPRSRSSITGKSFYEVSFKLEATFAGGEIRWRLIHNGREYGVTSVSYDD